ncbi:hypothetical protein dsx2_0199 [Desulfovibrio sp. X2]|uniref:hypothetical protein n=1 Tax=Desulfovibrio sp. X2 TaxID=941449 RepID=UPI000358BD41|nr:hypothetical protein [Desulfovibrio sp. X2]EPR42272.1 hypothetical protein dsx2_0199 [Desulfovibrio sp. X2]
MATIVPQSELHRKAVEWISRGLQEGKDLRALIAEAGMRFNMSPLDVEALERLYKDDLLKLKGTRS